MARIVVAGAGAIGASVAYHLALDGADDVVLVDPVGVAGGATSKGMGGVRQQFSTAAEVRLAQASIRFFEELGPPFFEQVGYLFLATTDAGVATLEERRAVQAELGVPVVAVSVDDIPELAPGVRVDDLRGGVFCGTDGVGDPVAVTRELVRRAGELGVEVREGVALEAAGDADAVVVACGANSAAVARALGVELPVRPLCRQLLETSPLAADPALPMTIELESGFHFRRRGHALVLAMVDAAPRWGFAAEVDETVFPDRLERLAHRFPAGAANVSIARAWAGLYDMTPDAHPIVGRVGDGVYAACGFSGHGFMQSPAVGRALAEEITRGASSFDLAPYRLDRFAEGASFPETAFL